MEELTGSWKTQDSIVRDREGNIKKEEEQLARWTEQFKRVFIPIYKKGKDKTKSSVYRPWKGLSIAEFMYFLETGQIISGEQAKQVSGNLDQLRIKYHISHKKLKMLTRRRRWSLLPVLIYSKLLTRYGLMECL